MHLTPARYPRLGRCSTTALPPFLMAGARKDKDALQAKRAAKGTARGWRRLWTPSPPLRFHLLVGASLTHLLSALSLDIPGTRTCLSIKHTSPKVPAIFPTHCMPHLYLVTCQPSLFLRGLVLWPRPLAAFPQLFNNHYNHTFFINDPQPCIPCWTLLFTVPGLLNTL